MARYLVAGMLFALALNATLTGSARPRENPVRLPLTVSEDPASVVVERGDHLWKISAAQLRSELGREAGDVEIWPYWRSVIEANVGHLRSGDPDLIYPGEVIELP